MRTLLATLLFFIGMGVAGGQSVTPPPSQLASDLRAMVLALSPAEIGVGPQQVGGPVWGVVMETGLDRGHYTLVVLADGTCSLYFSNGGGFIGAGTHADVAQASREFLAVANRLVGATESATDTEPPGVGNTSFFLLTFDGLRRYTAAEVDLGEQRDRMAPLFHAGHAVITEVRRVQP